RETHSLDIDSFPTRRSSDLKVLSEGEHEINDKTYHVKNDLYDVVPKKMKNVKLNVDKKGKAYVSYKRQFIKGTHAPKVDVSLKKEENKFTAFFKNLFR